jgi:hypothetical protein
MTFSNANLSEGHVQERFIETPDALAAFGSYWPAPLAAQQSRLSQAGRIRGSASGERNRGRLSP